MIRRFFKFGVILSALVLVALAAYGMNLYFQIRETAARDEAKAADAIVILGAAQYNGRPSPVLKARLDHAYDLFSKGLAAAIITTGSFGPDLNFSEAHVSTKYLIERGIDPAAIITEQGGSTTRDSIVAAARVMHAKGWKSAVVVSDGFHLFRLKRICVDNDILPYGSPVPNSPIETGASRFWHSLREVFLFSAYRLIDL